MEKLPPYNNDYEQAILGAILLNNNSIFTALEYITPSTFYYGSHSLIFRALINIIVDDDGEADLISLRERLEQQKNLEKAGDIAYIASLMDVVPTAANIEYHCQRLHALKIARDTLNAGIITATECYDYNTDGLVLLDQALSRFQNIGDTALKEGLTPIKSIIPEVNTSIIAISDQDDDVTGVHTGFKELDFMTKGWQPSDLIVLAGRPSMGKTAYSVQLALHTAVNLKKPVAYFSVETSKEGLTKRFISQHARISLNEIKQWTPEDWNTYSETAEILTNSPIFIDDTPAITPLALQAKARRLHQRQPLGLIIVDYIQIMGTAERHNSRYESITDISNRLKNTAKKLNVPLIALSQLSRKVEERKPPRPMMSDLRESGAIEQDADVVMMLYRPEYYDKTKDPGKAELIIGKQRNGPVGEIELYFQKNIMCFESVDNVHHEEPVEWWKK